jgi:hypothetical protein
MIVPALRQISVARANASQLAISEKSREVKELRGKRQMVERRVSVLQTAASFRRHG